MNKRTLMREVARGLSTRELAKKHDCSQTTIRYWLKKLRLATSPAPRKNSGPRCALCLNEKTGRGRLCWSCYTKVRRVRVKRAAIAYKGGECLRCAWTGPDAGFDFHHIGDNKEFNIGRAYCRSAESIRAELDKCILLCAMCHRLEHVNELSPEMLAEIDKKEIVLSKYGKLRGLVLELRTRGFTIDQIAKQVDLTKSRVARIIKGV